MKSQDHERLPGFVVQLAADTASFFLLGFEQLP